MKYSIGILAAAAMAVAASAGPVMTPPPVITALGGDVKAVFIYADAADTDVLGLAKPTPVVSNIFCNHTIGTCTGASPGQIVDLGTRSGLLKFTLADKTTGNTFDSVDPDTFGIYHADVRTSYTYAGVPALSQALINELALLPNVTFVAWEDHTLNNDGHDFDYNDLIFAFSNTAPNKNPGVPEPLTLSLMGAGLLGAFGLRRIKKS